MKATTTTTTTTTTTALLRVLLWLGASMNALGAEEVRITSVDEFIQFKDDVNNGTNYSGTTVFLDSDLSFDGETFKPIGKDWDNCFHGVFDGQGHVISNITMTSSSLEDVGLFGYSKGLTIKNVILDSSCSITSSFSSGYAFIGGVIGDCWTEEIPCTIENSVNMGSVTFSGTLSDGGYLYLGGIVGELFPSSKYDSTVKNCANYGDVTHTGESYYSYIGGIVGYSSYNFPTSKRVHIYNCLNHGTITHNGITTNELRLGGITGETRRTTIENCVSGGKISLLTTASWVSYVGSIVGYVRSDTTINYTYFTSDLSRYNKYGYAWDTPSESNTLSYDSTSFELSEIVSIGSYTGSSLIDALNGYSDYYILRDYSHWLLNKGNKAVSFIINGRTNPIKMNYQVILLPSLASEGNMSFDGWYTDDGLTTPLTEFEVTSETKLYGRYCSSSNFTVALDVNGGDELQYNPNAIVCNDAYLALPTPTRTGHAFLGWFTGSTGGDRIESGSKVTILDNHTLYAHWSINKYTLTFIFGNGTEPEVRVLEFNEAITYPADPVWAGYSFAGWDSNITNMPADNITITAQWTANNYTVTFNPSGGSVSQSTKVVAFYSAYGDLPTPNRTGYTFLGWFTEKNESITEGSIVKTPGNHTLYAHWSINKYTLTFDFGNGAEPEVRVLDFNETITYPADPVWAGYSFAGWDRNITNMPADNTTITAQWTANNYTVTFNPSGGSISQSTTKVVAFGSAYGELPNATRKGYTFLGWLNEKNESITGESIVEIPDNHTLFAQWTANNYTVTFNLNGGSVSQSTKVVTFGSAYGDLPTPNRTGYTFLGWFTEKNESITEESIVKIPDNHILYAHWSINNYTLTFIFNNGAEPEVFVLEFNETITYPTDPVRVGYSFAGWDRNITNMPANNITITALWTANNYAVTFNPSGGSISQSTKVVTFGSAYGELPIPNRTGYAFLGWFTEKNESITEESIVKIPDNHILYAHWSINKYTLTFIFGNGTEPEVRVLEFNETITYPADPVRVGYSFAGWDRDIANMPADNITITALWTAPSSGEKVSNVTLIVGIAVPVVVFIIAIFVVVVLVLYSRMKKNKKKSNEGRPELGEPLIGPDLPAGDRYQRSRSDDAKRRQ